MSTPTNTPIGREGSARCPRKPPTRVNYMNILSEGMEKERFNNDDELPVAVPRGHLSNFQRLCFESLRDFEAVNNCQDHDGKRSESAPRNLDPD